MLAVIDDFSRSGKLVGGRSAAYVRSALEDGDLETSLGQSASRSEAGNAPTNNSNCFTVPFCHQLFV
jgi:hypothetical protein